MFHNKPLLAKVVVLNLLLELQIHVQWPQNKKNVQSQDQQPTYGHGQLQIKNVFFQMLMNLLDVGLLDLKFHRHFAPSCLKLNAKL